MSNQPILQVDDLAKTYQVGGFLSSRPPVQAVAGVSFHIERGETLALVGESGCGKSTIGRIVMRLADASAGRITFDGEDLLVMEGNRLSEVRTKLQMVFQDPFGSLNPRKTIRQILSQPYKLAGLGDVDRRVVDLLNLVGLSPAERFIHRMPHEFSGGQRQRIAIARAFALQPKLVIADEPVSALDVSVRAQILKLMQRLQEETNVSYLFISHDLGVVRTVAKRVAVMYLGRLVETGPVEQIFSAPAHPYTKALLSASPLPDPEQGRTKSRIILKGDLPSPSNPPSGCKFHTRCPIARSICREIEPLLATHNGTQSVACHFPSSVSSPSEAAA